MNIKTLSDKNLFQNIEALKFAFMALISRIAAAVAQLYAIKVFLSSHSQDEYSSIIIVLGLTPVFLLFELGIAQTIQNKFNQRKYSAPSLIKIMLLHYLIIIVIGLFISKSQLIPFLILNESLINPTNIQIFTVGSLLLIISSNNIILQKVLLLLRRGYIFNRMILTISIFQVLGLYIYYKIGLTNPIISLTVFLIPNLIVSLLILISLAPKGLSKPISYEPRNSYDFFNTAKGFFIINAMAASMLTIDYWILSVYGAANQIASYHVVSRFFSIAYIVYASYLIFAAKNISKINETRAINEAKKTTIIIGIICVSVLFLLLVMLKLSKGINLISQDLEISYPLLIAGFTYFLVRVFADTNIILAGNQSRKRIAFIVYLIEISLAGALMYLLFPIYGEASLFFSLSIAYSAGIIYYSWKLKK